MISKSELKQTLTILERSLEFEPEDYLPTEPLFLETLYDHNASTEDMPTLFEKNRYIYVKEFLKDPLLSVAYRYLLMKGQIGHGTSDKKVPGAISLYGDPLMETILELARLAIEKMTGRKLLCAYAYCRVYQHGNLLKPHKDRHSCEISATLSLGQNVSEIRETKPDYVWPIFVDKTPIACSPGDMVVYQGCEVTHWREPFEGQTQGQVFFHYVDADGPYADDYKFDGRPMLGLPKRISATIMGGIAQLESRLRQRN